MTAFVSEFPIRHEVKPAPAEVFEQIAKFKRREAMGEQLSPDESQKLAGLERRVNAVLNARAYGYSD